MTFDIILPTLCRPSIDNAINSVIAQTFTDWRLYVVFGMNDCENHDSFNLVPVHDKIEVLGRQYLDGTDYGARKRNYGIRHSTNSWIAYIDDDDEWLPNHLETIVGLSQDHPKANMIRTAGQSFKMRHKSPRSSQLVKKMGPVNTQDILTVGMAHTREMFFKTVVGWRECDNHDHKLWAEMLKEGGKPVVTDQVTFHFKR